MSLALLLAFQAAAAQAPLPIEFDLATFRPDDQDPGRACLRTSPAEILVCGRRRAGNAYPLEEMALTSNRSRSWPNSP